MELQKIISKLHPFERRILPFLKSGKTLGQLSTEAEMQEIEAMRALQWLENKEALKISTETNKVISLDKNGLHYAKEGLPEQKLLQALTEKLQPLSAIAEKTSLTTEEINACLGLLKKKGFLDIKKEKELLLSITLAGKKALKTSSAEEHFLQRKFPLDFAALNTEERITLEELKARKNLLKIEEQKKITIILTDLGKTLAGSKIEGEVLNRLTSGLLKTGAWKNKEFRAYDVEVNVPTIHPGKKHFVNESLEYIKSIWLEMGFKEITGDYVQSAFWDLDVLFVPQDHPAREMQDTFYLHGKATLPSLWKTIKEVHEHGGSTGGRGWGYTFSKEESEQILLRTHTTVLSAHTLSKLKKEQLPAKFFMIGKVFRNETLDWKHLFEFYQVEGIVIDPNANLQHLKGYLTQFYKKMGFEKVRMRPAYFPYTEPSLEVDVFHPVKKEWVELGGAGIFRPEVVKPLLGFDCPVLAWGQGMARIVSEYWKISDVRELDKNDLKQIREAKAWLK